MKIEEKNGNTKWLRSFKDKLFNSFPIIQSRYSLLKCTLYVCLHLERLVNAIIFSIGSYLYARVTSSRF